MSNQLQRTLSTRADRADRAPDLDEVMELVRGRTSQRRQRRRTAIAAGTTSLAVAALVATASVVWAGTDSPPTSHSAVQRGGAAAPADGTAGLVAAPAAPASSETSLGLLPEGWTYEGSNGAGTTYIPEGTAPTSPTWYVGKIAVLVGQRYNDASTYTLTVAGGRHARIDGPDDTGVSSISTLLPDRDGVPLEVTIQVPASAHVTDAQFLAMAGALDVRSTVHYAVG